MILELTSTRNDNIVIDINIKKTVLDLKEMVLEKILLNGNNNSIKIIYKNKFLEDAEIIENINFTRNNKLIYILKKNKTENENLFKLAAHQEQINTISKAAINPVLYSAVMQIFKDEREFFINKLIDNPSIKILLSDKIYKEALNKCLRIFLKIL